MVSQFFNSASGHLLTVILLTNGLTEHVRAADNTTLPKTTSLQGNIQGVNMVTHHNRTVYGFKGIPFAEPPVGDLRFKAPVAAGAWNGTFNATSDSNDCPQIDEKDRVTRIGDEDCLYLHVYTPQLPTSDNSSLLPVMVFIYGGRFKLGNMNPGRYGPNFLLDQDVVLVTPSFRLGLLGYLTTGDEVSPGNYGLKDIVLALKWVQDNIQYFGGDPKRVTLFGGSSGAMSIHLLTLSDSTEGLFHKYITESGVALGWSLNASPHIHVDRAIQLAEDLGCPTNTSTLLVNCLRTFNASQLIDTYFDSDAWPSLPNYNHWLPAVEPDIEGALLTDTPTNLFAAGKIRDLPWISLVTRDEGYVSTMLFYEDADVFEGFLEEIDYLLPIMLGYSFVVDDETAVTEALKAYYLNDLTADRTLLLENVTNLFGDATFYYPAYDALQQQLVIAKNPQYYACFEYRGVLSYTYLYSGGSTNYTDVGTHGDELIYLFENLHNRFGPPGYKHSDVDWTMVDKMVRIWTTFATNGSTTIVDSNRTIIWEPYSSSNNYLRIGSGSDLTLEMQNDLYIERIQFWKELMSAPTPDEFRAQVQLLPIALCVGILFAISLSHQRSRSIQYDLLIPNATK